MIYYFPFLFGPDPHFFADPDPQIYADPDPNRAKTCRSGSETLIEKIDELSDEQPFLSKYFIRMVK